MRKLLFSMMLLAGTALGGETAHAQAAIEGRVGRLEGEMRAVQRKVFPGGGGQYVQPDNSPPPSDDALPGTPASSPVADLTQRVDALEGQVRMLTGQVETLQHHQQVQDGRIKALEVAAAPPAVSPDAGAAPARPPVDRPPSDRSGLDGAVSSKPNPRVGPKPAGSTVPARSTDPVRAAKVAAIDRPDTGDIAEDSYLYGYRLWSAKLYPEAEAQFVTVTSKYPTSKRASYAQNLLGRAYLEDGKPSLASLAFLDSYKKWPDGDRAPESLVYLAQALVKLDKPASQVCKVYTELQRSYAARIEADPKLKATIAKGRADSSCP